MKRIRIRFNVLTSLILLAVFVGLTFMIKTHAAMNLFFQTMRPCMIEKVTICMGYDPVRYTELTDREISELVVQLNDVHLTGKGIRSVPPSEMDAADYRIYLITGQTLIISVQNERELSLGSYTFTNAGGNTLDIAKLRDKHWQAHSSLE